MTRGYAPASERSRRGSQPLIARHPFRIRREQKHHRSVGELGQQFLRPRRLHRRTTFRAPRLGRRHVRRPMRHHAARHRLIVVALGHAVELEPDGAVRPAAGLAMECVEGLGDIESERSRLRAGGVRETGRHPVLRRRRPPAVGDRERPFLDLQRIHVEHIPARLRARQTVVDEVQVWLLDLVRMRRFIPEVALERVFERLRVAEGSNSAPERGERGIRFRRYHCGGPGNLAEAGLGGAAGHQCRRGPKHRTVLIVARH